MTASAIYHGVVTHTRHVPRPHQFRFRLYMLYLDLDELPGLALALAPLFGVEQPRPLSFHRQDYLGDPRRPLADCVRDRVEAALGRRPGGAVRLLTHVRSLGYVFNPVSFYYCFDRGGALDAVVAEITNTPWRERHAYVLDAGATEARASFTKAFHVSPFFPMQQRYQWRLTAPGQGLVVDMRNREDGREVFRATLALVRRPLTRAGLLAAALRHPAVTARLHAAIYIQAGLLWLKGEPYFEHPRNQAPARGGPPSWPQTTH